MSISHLWELQQNIDNRLFLRMILRRDCNFFLPVLGVTLYGVNLDTDVFRDLGLSVECWFVDNGSCYSMRFIRSCFCRLLCFDMGGKVCSFARGGMYIAKCGLFSALRGSPRRTMKRSGRGGHHKC